MQSNSVIMRGPSNFTISKAPTVISSAPKLYTGGKETKEESEDKKGPASKASSVSETKKPASEPKKKKQKTENKAAPHKGAGDVSHALAMAEKVKQSMTTTKQTVPHPQLNRPQHINPHLNQPPSHNPRLNQPPNRNPHLNHPPHLNQPPHHNNPHLNNPHLNNPHLNQPPPHHNPPPQEEKKESKKKQKKNLRYGGGQVWEDHCLAEWDPDDFRMFAGDLGNDVTDELLHRYFSHYPSFAKAKVVRDKRTNKSKGYGFISFKDSQDYIRAMKEMNGKYLGSRPIKLRKSMWKDRNLDVVQKKLKEKQLLGLK